MSRLLRIVVQETKDGFAVDVLSADGSNSVGYAREYAKGYAPSKVAEIIADYFANQPQQTPAGAILHPTSLREES